MALKYLMMVVVLILGLVATAPVCWGSAAEMERLSGEGNKAAAEARYPQALAAFQQGLHLARRVDNNKAQEIFLNNIGAVYWNLGQYDQALTHFQQALTIIKEIKNRPSEGKTLSNIGLVYNDLGQYEQALAYFRQALAIHQEGKDRIALGAVLTNIGLAYRNLGQYEPALEHHRQALDIYREQKEFRGVAGELNNIGIIYNIQGHYDQALEFYQQALALDRKNKDRQGEGADLSNIAVTYTDLGQYDKALAHLHQALAINKEIRVSMAVGANLNNIGMVYWNLENPEKALEFYQQALALNRKIKDRRGEGGVLSNIGVVYSLLGQYEKALAYFQPALAIHREIKDRLGEGIDLNNIGNVLMELGQYEKAYNMKAQSLLIAQEGKEPDSLWRSQRGLGAVEAKLARDTDAIRHYEQALDTIESMRGGLKEKEARSSFMEEKLYVYDELIGLLRFRHEQDPSRGYDRKSLEIFERKQGRQFLEEMGRSGARKFAGLPDDIKKQETQLENLWDKLQADLTKERSKPEPEPQTLQALESELQQTQAAFQTLKEQLRTAYPDYYALKYPRPVSLTELQNQVLQPGEVLLVYGVMPHNTCLWVIGKDKFVLYPLAVGEKELTEKVKRFRQGPEAILQAIVHGQPAAKLQGLVDSAVTKITPVEQELFDLLLPAAARQQIGSAQVLYIVPTGPLYSLPFEALRTQAGQAASRYLVEDYAVAYLSSASLLQNLRQARLRKKEPAAYPLLAFANPDYAVDAAPAATRGTGIKTKSVDPKARSKVVSSFQGLRTRAYRQIMGGDFVSLPDTEVEVKEIKEILQAPDPTQPLQLRQAAARSQVLALNQSERLKNYRYLIFACHGILPGEVDRISQPALVLSDPDPGNQQEGYLTMADVFGLQFNADLVTLSACNSGGGKAQKGEGVIGLTRAFMYAGTQAVAVTQWSVESGAAKELNVGMFRYLSQNKDRAGALREIKLAMLRGRHGDLYRHPFFWAPLVIFGDGHL